MLHRQTIHLELKSDADEVWNGAVVDKIVGSICCGVQIFFTPACVNTNELFSYTDG